MRRLSFIILAGFTILSMSLTLMKPSPHGKDFRLNCGLCHNADSWEVNSKTMTFNHSTTDFVLEGRHQQINCRQCHNNLVFSEAKTTCISCHTDFHQQTVRHDCARCHTPKSWIITDASRIHQSTRFPLVGAHMAADCYDCHQSGSLLNFEPIGVNCIDCHRNNYMAAKNPDHLAAGFSTNCYECHKVFALDWIGGGFNHDIFPLTLGHANVLCIKCHPAGNFQVSNLCYSCHKSNYDASSNPNHSGCNFSTNCIQCHTTNPGWHPALFDHNTTSFPLTGAHTAVACNHCHTSGCQGTPNTCVGCHLANYNATTNPNHVNCNLSQNCIQCHTTNPGWTPALFDHSTTGYILSGAHTNLSCNKCHTNGCAGTPATCYGCHQTDYNQTTNPNHASAQFPTDCELCHNQQSWIPSTFNHDGLYFPIYSGKHNGTWSSCTQCHPNPSNYAIFTCLTCHTQSATNNEHNDVPGYSYNSTACLSCHPDGTADKSGFKKRR